LPPPDSRWPRPRPPTTQTRSRPPAAPRRSSRPRSTRTRRARVRTLYKLEAFGDLPFWVNDGARADALATRGAARRVILRDLEERKILRAEAEAARADVTRLESAADKARFAAAQAPRDGFFARPVDGDVVASFGSYNDERTHLRLVRRGIELHARSREVVAAAAGQVRWVGGLRGLGTVVVIDHGQGLVSVTSGLADPSVQVGDLVAGGDAIGRAAGQRVGFEVRRGGRAIDPFPLLGARR
jgi:septal ring factor EnvC (AmiA/AmiB activator)